MEMRYSTHPEHAKHFTTEELRQHYLIQELFVPEEVKLVYTHEDRVIIGGIYPVNKSVALEGNDQIKAETFLERRELGILMSAAAVRSRWTVKLTSWPQKTVSM